VRKQKTLAFVIQPYPKLKFSCIAEQLPRKNFVYQKYF